MTESKSAALADQRDANRQALREGVLERLREVRDKHLAAQVRLSENQRRALEADSDALQRENVLQGELAAIALDPTLTQEEREAALKDANARLAKVREQRRGAQEAARTTHERLARDLNDLATLGQTLQGQARYWNAKLGLPEEEGLVGHSNGDAPKAA